MELLDGISTLRINLPQNLISSQNRQTVARSIAAVSKKYASGFPLLDPIDDMCIDDSQFAKLIRKIESLESKLRKMPVHKSKNIDEKMIEMKRKMEMQVELKELKKTLRQSETLALKDELKAMKRVLRR